MASLRALGARVVRFEVGHTHEELGTILETVRVVLGEEEHAQADAASLEDAAEMPWTARACPAAVRRWDKVSAAKVVLKAFLKPSFPFKRLHVWS